MASAGFFSGEPCRPQEEFKQVTRTKARSRRARPTIASLGDYVRTIPYSPPPFPCPAKNRLADSAFHKEAVPATSSPPDDTCPRARQLADSCRFLTSSRPAPLIPLYLPSLRNSHRFRPPSGSFGRSRRGRPAHCYTVPPAHRDSRCADSASRFSLLNHYTTPSVGEPPPPSTTQGLQYPTRSNIPTYAAVVATPLAPLAPALAPSPSPANTLTVQQA